MQVHPLPGVGQNSHRVGSLAYQSGPFQLDSWTRSRSIDVGKGDRNATEQAKPRRTAQDAH